jgi:hypothetical protein
MSQGRRGFFRSSLILVGTDMAQRDCHVRISFSQRQTPNLHQSLEYTAIIIGIVGCIFVYKSLPVETRPAHPMLLLWTDNSTAKSWTKKILGLKTPQGCSLACVFAHLLMFSDVGI